MALFRRLRATLRPGRLDSQLDDEFQFHFEQRVDDFMAQGMSVEAARREALRLFGNRTHLRESTRDRDVIEWLQTILQDLRFAARTMRRRPGFAAAAVLSLALGIGANTALFSVLDGLLLRLLPVEDAGRLVVMRDAPTDRFGYPAYETLRTGTRLLSGISGVMYVPSTGEIIDHGQRVQAALQIASGNYFEMLGVRAARGRVFQAGDEAVAVISEHYWRTRYHSSPEAIGEHIGWADRDVTIIGVAPADFHGVLLDVPADIFLTLELAIPPTSALRTRGRSVSLMGRMRAGVSRPQVASEASALLRRTVRVEDGSVGISALRERVSRPLIVLEFLVAFVLLIACSNLANLALAGAASRQREMAVRQAIGAGRGRLIRQSLTESALLAVAGGGLAMVVAQAINASLLRFLPPNVAYILPNLAFRADGHVLTFTAVVTVATCVLFGLVPALQATRTAPISGLRQTPGAGAALAGWLGRGLVIGEVALCTAVLMTSGLFVRTLRNLRDLDPARSAEHIVTANVPTPRGHTDAERIRFFDTLRDRAAALPGVRSAGYIHIRPLTGHFLNADIEIEGRPGLSKDDASVLIDRISPGLLSTLGVPLVAGRDFNERDDAGAPQVAIVNESFVRRLLAVGPVLGARVRFPGDRQTLEVVGVVKDTRWVSLREPPLPLMFRPYRQDPNTFVTLAVRAEGGSRELAPALFAIAREMHPPLELDDIVPFSELEDRALFVERMIAQVSAAFGMLALAIACIGLYGLLAFGVVRRTREIGIRMALGASRSGVQWLVLRESAVLLGLGLAVGIPAAFTGARLAASLLFGLTPADPGTMGAALGIMTAISLAASAIPARRAVRIDPTVALRED